MRREPEGELKQVRDCVAQFARGEAGACAL
jgi:hypothetical protein